MIKRRPLFGQYVTLEITFCCCFIPAILTLKSFTFMNGLCVFVETSLSPFCVNFCSQCWHRNIFPLYIDWMCVLRLHLSVYFWSQCWHWKVLPSCIDCICLFRLPLFAYFCSQCWQWYVLPSCTDSIALSSQCQHWYVLPSCIECMCLLRLYVSSETNLVCKIMSTKRTAMFEQIHERPATLSNAKASLSVVNLKACTCSVCKYNTCSFHQAALNT